MPKIIWSHNLKSFQIILMTVQTNVVVILWVFLNFYVIYYTTLTNIVTINKLNTTLGIYH